MTPSYRFNDVFGFRGHIGFLPISQDMIDDAVGDNWVEINGYPYVIANADIGAWAQSAGAFADLYGTPKGQNLQFRVSFGVLKPTLGASFVDEINRLEYFPEVDKVIHLKALEGEGEFGSLAPYLGVGIDLGAKEGWGISFDLGMALNLETDFNVGGVATNPEDQPLVDEAFEARKKAYLEGDDKFSSPDFFPHLAVNLVYHY